MNTSPARFELERERLLGLAAANPAVGIERFGRKDRDFRLAFSVDSASDFDEITQRWETCQEQRIELSLPLNYPQVAPQLRWLSPIIHPNISSSGFLKVADVGFEWTAESDLLELCQRLWDVSRLAFVQPDRINNYSAERAWKKMLAKGNADQATADLSLWNLPTDGRSLQTAANIRLDNIIHFRALSESQVSLDSTSSQNPQSGTAAERGTGEAILEIVGDSHAAQVSTPGDRDPIGEAVIEDVEVLEVSAKSQDPANSQKAAKPGDDQHGIAGRPGIVEAELLIISEDSSEPAASPQKTGDATGDKAAGPGRADDDDELFVIQ